MNKEKIKYKLSTYRYEFLLVALLLLIFDKIFFPNTSIGFGDIYPSTDTSRLVTAFFGMIGQFYMVAVVGIIISKFSSR